MYTTLPVTGRRRTMDLVNDLVNAEKMASLYPDTFHLPDTGNIRPADYVKVSNGLKRFWVRVSAVDGDRLAGTVGNNLIHDRKYDLGDPISFEKKHVYDIDPAH